MTYSDIRPSLGGLTQVRFASVDVATAGDNTIVAGVAGRRIQLVHYLLNPQGAVNLFWRDGAGGAALSGTIVFGAAGFLDTGNAEGLLATSDGNALVLNLSGAVQVSGHISYMLL